MTPQDAPNRTGKRFPPRQFFKGFNGIRAAGGVEATTTGKQGTDGALVEANQSDKNLIQQHDHGVVSRCPEPGAGQFHERSDDERERGSLVWEGG